MEAWQPPNDAQHAMLRNLEVRGTGFDERRHTCFVRCSLPPRKSVRCHSSFPLWSRSHMWATSSNAGRDACPSCGSTSRVSAFGTSPHLPCTNRPSFHQPTHPATHPSTHPLAHAANLLSSWADVARVAALSPNLACLRMGQNRLRPITSGLEVTDLATHELLAKGFQSLQVIHRLRTCVTTPFMLNAQTLLEP